MSKRKPLKFTPREDTSPFVLSNDKQRNLAKLALYIHSLPEDYSGFNMEHFFRYPSDSIRQAFQPCRVVGDKITCGTSACLAGHGPSAGIPFENGEDWLGYVNRVFIEYYEKTSLDVGWDWLFCQSHSNDHMDGFKRIVYFLLSGGPPEEYYGTFSYRDNRKRFIEAIHDIEVIPMDIDLIEMIAKGKVVV